MYLSACILLTLLVLAGAQDDAPVAGKNVKPSKGDSAPPTQFAQPLATGDGATSNSPQSANAPSTLATSDSAPVGNGELSGAAKRPIDDSAPSTQAVQPPAIVYDTAASNAPQSNSPSTIMSQTDVSSSVSIYQNAQQTTTQSPLSETPVELAASSRPPVPDSNSFSSAPLPIPSSALQQTSESAFVTQPVALPASAMQPASTAQPTAIPTSGTQPAGQPESTIQPSAIPYSTAQPAAIPASNQPTGQPEATNQWPGIPTGIFSTAVQNQFTSAIPTPQSTNIPIQTIPSTFVPPNTAPSTVPPQPSIFSTAFAFTSSTQPPDTPTHIQIIFNTSYSRIIANGAYLTAYSDGLAPSIAAAAHASLYRITNVTVYSQPQTDFLVLRFIVQPSVATSSIVPQAFSTFPTGLTRQFADDTMPYDGTVSYVVNRLRLSVLADPQPFLLIDQNGAVLTVNRDSNDKIFAAWTDEGPCPTDFCRSPDVCVCSLTGTLQCEHQTRPNLLLLLLLLLLIPLVIIIVVIVVVYRKRSRQISREKKQTAEKRVVRADMLSYHEYIAREKDPQQPKISTIASRGTLNESTLNTLHRSLGEHLSIAFNGSTFMDITGVLDNADNTSRDAILPKDD